MQQTSANTQQPTFELSSGQAQVIARPDGTQIHCVAAGRGPSIVLAHGYLLDASLHQLLFERLVALGYRVIAFDQRGHGASTIGRDGLGAAALASDYTAVLEHFDVRDGTLAGHSMGGFLSIVFCLQQPELARRRLRKLVLIGANAGSVARGSLQNRLQIPLLKSGALRQLWKRPQIGRRLVSQLFGPDPNPGWVEFTRQLLLRQREKQSFPMLNAMLHEDYYARLHEIPLPAVVLCGEHDRTCPRWHSEQLGSRLPQARNVWLPNVGHMMHFEAPEAIIQALSATS